MTWSNYNLTEHPFLDFIYDDTETLVVGTFPSAAKRSFDFYYASEQNRFWSLIEIIFKPNFGSKNGIDAQDERETFLRKQKIGMTDMLSRVSIHIIFMMESSF